MSLFYVFWFDDSDSRAPQKSQYHLKIELIMELKSCKFLMWLISIPRSTVQILESAATEVTNIELNSK